jgi:2-methylcitrate dehydratase PrpD
VDEPKGDPGNTLSRAEIEEKAIRLALFSGGATESEMQELFLKLWNISRIEQIGKLLPS